ncbi:MAG: type I polyketide synthase, partial [Pseudomonadota bacterium]
QTTLHRLSTGEARVVFHSRPSDKSGEPWTRHAAATLRPADQGVAAAEGTQHAAGRAVDVDNFYERLSARGLVYGPAFRGIATLSVENADVTVAAGDNAPQHIMPARIAVAQIDTPRDGASYTLHPAALDAAFQTTAAILQDDEAVYLPSAVGACEVVGPCPSGAFYASTCLRDGAGGEGTLVADITLTDLAGAVFARIEGLVLTRLGAAPTAEAPLGALRVDWVAVPPPSVPTEATATQWIVAEDAHGTGKALSAQLVARGHTVEAVAPGPEQASEVVRLLAERREAGLIHFAYHPATLPAAAVRAPSPFATSEAVRDGCAAVLRAVKAMIGRRAPVWLVTRGAQAVGENETPSLVEAPLWGFGRILAIEHPEMMGGLIDLDPANAGEAALLAETITSTDQNRPIALSGGARHVSRLQPVKEDAAWQPAFRADAAYLLTGGLTGLGLVTARWMAAAGAAHFLMVGRTPLPPRAAWASLSPHGPEAERIAGIRALEAAGASVHVESVDVADARAMAALVARWQSEARPPIRGVIHAAGGIDDKLIGSMEPADFAGVMAAKVDGSLALHHACRELPLEFFVMFASATSVLGQIGQANYAAANAFQDGLAFARRAAGAPACVLNWGPWGEVGIYARRGLKDRAGIEGVGDILPQEGMLALGKAMAGGQTQSILVKADWSKVAPTPLIAALADPTPAHAQDLALSVVDIIAMSEAERGEAIATMVVEMVAAVLKLEPGEVDRRRPITALGMDSIMAVELRNRIRGSTGVVLTMVDLFTGSVAEIAGALEAALMADEALATLVDEVEGLPEDVVAALLSGEEAVA